MKLTNTQLLVAGLALWLCMDPGSAAAGPNPPFSDRIASEVDGQPILLSTLFERTTVILKGFGQKPPVPGRPFDGAGLKALRASLQELEHECLIANEAERQRITVGPEEIDRVIEEVASGNGLTRADLIARLPDSGLTEATYRASLTRQLLRMKLFNIHLARAQGSGSSTGGDVEAAQLEWIEGLAQRWPVNRSLEFEGDDSSPRPKAELADACQGSPGLPRYHWRLTAWPPALQTGRIGAIRHQGLPDPLPPRLASRLHARTGQAVDPAEVRNDLKRLWESGAYFDVAASTLPGKNGVVLTYAVQRRPRVGQVAVHAEDALREPVIIGTLGLVAGQVVPSGRFHTGLASLHQRLEEKGYLKATVEVRHRLTERNRVDLCVTVKPGPKYRSTGVRFEGNKVLSDKVLRECLAQDPGKPLEADAWMLQTRLSACAYDRGLIDIKISGPKRAVDDKALTITQIFSIEEGKVYTLESLSVAGDLVAAPELYQSRLGLKAGGIFSRARLGAAIQRINDLHAAYGRDDLDVIPETKIDTESGRIGVTLRIQKR